MTSLGHYLLASHLATTTPAARPRADRSWLVSTVVFVVVGVVILWKGRGCR